jgi:hypothetical protein
MTNHFNLEIDEMRTHMKATRWLLAALAVALMALPAGRRADAAVVPLYQAYQFGGWFLCVGYCDGGLCCEIVPKPPVR